MTVFLTTEDLLQLAADLGVGPVRDVGLLESACARPKTILWGERVYPGIDDQAAALLESVVGNHPLMDGNKRLGWLAVAVFYGLNGVTFDVPDDDVYDLVVQVAAGVHQQPVIARVFAQWRQH